MRKILILTTVLTVTFGDVDIASEKYTNLKSFSNIPPVFWRALVNIQQLWLNVNSKRKIQNESGVYLQEPFSDLTPFPCDTVRGKSIKRPSSVHKLRPGDIDVIGAIGDSLTTASGALSTKLGHMFTENRGLSWSIGGQWTWRNTTTLPNILKEFNPNLIGYSVNDSFTYSPGVEFNTAEIGAITFDLLGMAQVLVERFKKDRRVNFETDWKMVTIAIGANDICSYVCSLDDPNMLPEIHRKNLMETLRYLKGNLPRAFINVVSKPKVRNLLDFTLKTNHCELLQLGMCSCFSGLFFNASSETRKWFEDIEDRYRKVEEKVAKSKEFRKLNDFAVVYQPFGINTTVSVVFF